jgi:hypothetical protein
MTHLYYQRFIDGPPIDGLLVLVFVLLTLGWILL